MPDDRPAALREIKAALRAVPGSQRGRRLEQHHALWHDTSSPGAGSGSVVPRASVMRWLAASDELLLGLAPLIVERLLRALREAPTRRRSAC
jgi:hypothetical protein